MSKDLRIIHSQKVHLKNILVNDVSRLRRSGVCRYLWTLQCWGWCASSSDTLHSSLGTESPPLWAGRRRSLLSVEGEQAEETGLRLRLWLSTKCVQVLFFFCDVHVWKFGVSDYVLSRCGMRRNPPSRRSLMPSDGLIPAAALNIFLLW